MSRTPPVGITEASHRPSTSRPGGGAGAARTVELTPPLPSGARIFPTKGLRLAVWRVPVAVSGGGLGELREDGVEVRAQGVVGLVVREPAGGGLFAAGDRDPGGEAGLVGGYPALAQPVGEDAFGGGVLGPFPGGQRAEGPRAAGDLAHQRAPMGRAGQHSPSCPRPDAGRGRMGPGTPWRPRPSPTAGTGPVSALGVVRPRRVVGTDRHGVRGRRRAWMCAGRDRSDGPGWGVSSTDRMTTCVHGSSRASERGKANALPW